MENRVEICELLTELLRKTRSHYDVVRIEYRPERALTYIHYASGTQVPVVAEGSDIEMAIKILNRVAEKEHLDVPGKA